MFRKTFTPEIAIAGKVVRDHQAGIRSAARGRNIATEYKWDGTDQYGGKLERCLFVPCYQQIKMALPTGEFKTVDLQGTKVDTDKYFNFTAKMYLIGVGFNKQKFHEQSWLVPVFSF